MLFRQEMILRFAMALFASAAAPAIDMLMLLMLMSFLFFHC